MTIEEPLFGYITEYTPELPPARFKSYRDCPDQGSDRKRFEIDCGKTEYKIRIWKKEKGVGPKEIKYSYPSLRLVFYDELTSDDFNSHKPTTASVFSEIEEIELAFLVQDAAAILHILTHCRGDRNLCYAYDPDSGYAYIECREPREAD